MQLAQQVHHRFAVLRVEVAGGLVREQDRAARPRSRAPRRPAAAGRPRAGWAGAWRDGAMPTRSSASSTRSRRSADWHAAIGQGQLDVLEDGEVADQVEALEDEPDLAVADARALAEIEILNGLARDGVGPIGRRVEQAEDRTAAWTCRSPRARRWPRIRPGRCRDGFRTGRGSRLRPCRRPWSSPRGGQGSGRVHRSPCAGRVVPAFIL